MNLLRAEYLAFSSALTFFLARSVDQTAEDGFCEKTDEGIKCVSEENLRLVRLDGGQVGDVQDIAIYGDRILHMKTASLKPHVFEIDDFLTEEECNHFVSLATDIGMVKSKTEKHEKGGKGVRLFDLNSDKQLDLTEMKLTIESGYDIFFEDEDVLKMYGDLGLDTNNDSLITNEELMKVTPAELKKYLDQCLQINPEKHSRYSKQAWLYPDQSADEVFKAVQERVSKVVQLPLDLIRLSDFQVVNYGMKGHYNAHYDSSNIKKDVPCCDRGKIFNCRSCRFMTVLFYLNDVASGGETAFPFADKEEINETRAHLERAHHLYKNCDNASLRVSAKKGKAIFWYNHLTDSETGWMGEMDNFTLHGGCPVKGGEKWIANFWIRTNDDKSKDIIKMKEFRYAT